MSLKLQSNLDDVERCDAESGHETCHCTGDDYLRSCALYVCQVKSSNGSMLHTSSLSRSMRDIHPA